MSIWRTVPDAGALNALHEETAVARLGIEIVEVGDDSLRATMPVDARTVQPFGQLHGGASVLLAETLASAAGNHTLAGDDRQCVGIAVTANHLRPVRGGSVVGTARPAHLGRTTQVWDVDVEDERGRRVSTCRVTLAVVER